MVPRTLVRLIRTAVLSVAVLLTSCATRDQDVFVTSIRFTGNLGGRDSADAKCTAIAHGGWKKPGMYHAWLATSTVAAADAIVGDGPWAAKGDVFYQQMFPNRAALRTGPVNGGWLDEVGGYVPAYDDGVWTGTGVGGATIPSYLCDDWTSNAGGGEYARMEFGAGESNAWTTDLLHAGSYCTDLRHLYCFEE